MLESSQSVCEEALSNIHYEAYEDLFGCASMAAVWPISLILNYGLSLVYIFVSIRDSIYLFSENLLGDQSMYGISLVESVRCV